MTAREFLAGHGVVEGDARSSRVIAPARARRLRDGPAPSAAGAADLPPRWRARARGCRTSAIARSPARSPPARCAGRRAFDHVIAAFAGRPLAQLDPEVLAILRISIFQLLHLDRVPASAVVNDAVELARQGRQAQRRRLRQRAAAPRLARTDACRCRCRHADLRRDARPRFSLPITLSHPRWLAARWLDRHGFEAAEAWARFNNAPAPLTLRANTLKTTRDELAPRLARARRRDASRRRFAPRRPDRHAPAIRC